MPWSCFATAERRPPHSTPFPTHGLRPPDSRPTVQSGSMLRAEAGTGPADSNSPSWEPLAVNPSLSDLSHTPALGAAQTKGSRWPCQPGLAPVRVWVGQRAEHPLQSRDFEGFCHAHVCSASGRPALLLAHVSPLLPAPGPPGWIWASVEAYAWWAARAKCLPQRLGTHMHRISRCGRTQDEPGNTRNAKLLGCPAQPLGPCPRSWFSSTWCHISVLLTQGAVVGPAQGLTLQPCLSTLHSLPRCGRGCAAGVLGGRPPAGWCGVGRSECRSLASAPSSCLMSFSWELNQDSSRTKGVTTLGVSIWGKKANVNGWSSEVRSPELSREGCSQILSGGVWLEGDSSQG